MIPLSRPSHQTLARPPRSQPGARVPVTPDAPGARITAQQGTPQPGSEQGQPVTRAALAPPLATRAHITAPQGTPQPCSVHGQPITRAALAPLASRARHSHGLPTAPAALLSPCAWRRAAARARTARPSIPPRHGTPKGTPKANPRGRL
jgi:hypothetical protein